MALAYSGGGGTKSEGRSDLTDLLSALSEIKGARPKGGFTTEEFSREAGKSAKWCLEQIKRLINAGRVEYAGTVPSVTIAGRRCHTPVYRVVSSG